MTDIKLFFKSHKGLSIIILVYLIFCFYFTSKINHFLLNSKYRSTAENSAVFSDIPLLENESYSFDMEAGNSNWSGITIFFDRIEKEAPVSVSMQIQDEGGKVVFAYSPAPKDLNNTNNYFRFNFGAGE